jgi:hypothetical protein
MIEIRKFVRYRTERRVPELYKDHIGAQAYPVRVAYKTLQYRHATFVGGERGWSEWKNVETVVDTSTLDDELLTTYGQKN